MYSVARYSRQRFRSAPVATETEHQRNRRRHQRVLFDRVADLYDATRRGYPIQLVEFMVSTAQLDAGARVLEVGCGTGQLTRQLAHYEFDLTAIDIGPAMIASAQRRIVGPAVQFEAISFEDFDAEDESFDLVVAGTAFHWIDPEVKFTKSGRFLRPCGWLALLSTGEKYDDPFGSELVDLWAARSDDGGRWVTQRKLSDTEIITSVELFEAPVEKSLSERMTLPVDVVIGVENTRATALSWGQDAVREFNSEMRDRLGAVTEVALTQETTLTMARVCTDGCLR